MKAAFTTTGADLDAPMDTRFGRAAGFLIVDTETGEFSAVDNAANLNAVQGAGVQAAQKVLDAGAEAVVTGQIGPKAFATLQAAGVVVYGGATGTARDALAALNEGRLQQTGAPTVPGHGL